MAYIKTHTGKSHYIEADNAVEVGAWIHFKKGDKHVESHLKADLENYHVPGMSNYSDFFDDMFRNYGKPFCRGGAR